LVSGAERGDEVRGQARDWRFQKEMTMDAALRM
jgi:hypothetical protein